MITIGGHNPMGSVIHLVVGPETEMFMDIHGSMIVPIVDLLNAFNKNENVFISVTRCKSEMATQMMLKGAGIPFMTSFPESVKNIVNPSAEEAKECKAEAKKETSEKGTVEKCKYCKRETNLLPIPGFKICVVCAQIELGLAKDKKEKKA